VFSLKQDPKSMLNEYENICINCPGSLWGEKSICRIHNKSIGDIASCEQWIRNESVPYKVNDGQVTFTDLEPAIEIVQKTEEDLRDYHWIVKEIERLQDYLNKAVQSFGPGSRLVTLYGLEATLPNGKGLNIDKNSITEERYERQWKRLEKLKEKVKKIDSAAKQIVDEKERTVLECILDGVRMNIVARHVGISRTRLNEIKRLIVKKMAWVLYEEELKS
jgi:hypothetical protein